MRVSELIERLQKIEDQTAEVLVGDDYPVLNLHEGYWHEGDYFVSKDDEEEYNAEEAKGREVVRLCSGE